MSISLIKLTTTVVYRAWLKSEFLFRTGSIETNLVTSLQFLSNLCYYALRILTKYGAIPCSLIFTLIAALLKAVLHMNTQPFRKGRVETRNRTLGTVENKAPVQKGPKWWRSMYFKHETWIFELFHVIRRINSFIDFLLWKTLWSFVHFIIFCWQRGNKHFDVFYDVLDLYFFRLKKSGVTLRFVKERKKKFPGFSSPISSKKTPPKALIEYFYYPFTIFENKIQKKKSLE